MKLKKLIQNLHYNSYMEWNQQLNMRYKHIMAIRLHQARNTTRLLYSRVSKLDKQRSNKIWVILIHCHIFWNQKTF